MSHCVYDRVVTIKQDLTNSSKQKALSQNIQKRHSDYKPICSRNMEISTSKSGKSPAMPHPSGFCAARLSLLLPSGTRV